MIISVGQKYGAETASNQFMDADCGEHIGAIMNMDDGAVTSFSGKLMTKARSSTEVERIVVDDVLPQISWTRYFMECQGFKAKESIMLQDDKSTKVFEKNGKASGSK